MSATTRDSSSRCAASSPAKRGTWPISSAVTMCATLSAVGEPARGRFGWAGRPAAVRLRTWLLSIMGVALLLRFPFLFGAGDPVATGDARIYLELADRV